MTHTLFKKTAFALGTGCCFGLLALALTTQPANAQTQAVEKSYTAPGESNPNAVAKSKPGKAGGVSVKDKQKPVVTETAAPAPKAQPQPAAQPKPQAEQKAALETLKKKVAADKAPEKAVKPAVETSELVQKVTYGDNVQDWVAKPGDTVQGLLMKWSEESGWTLIWKLDRDYILEAGVVFRGTYMDVAMALLRSFARAIPAPIGTFYKGNRVLVVSTREDENEG